MAETGIDIHKAAVCLNSGKIVAIPTETVYGLAANALNREAVVSVFEAKNRPFFDPLILHFHSVEQIKAYTNNFSPIATLLAGAFWPGPLTMLLEKNDKVPDLVTAGSPYVAVRIPNHPLTLSLLQLLDFPLAAPSANPFGYISPTTARHVEEQLGEKVSYILDGGKSKVGIESTIVSFVNTEPLILRLGGISEKELTEKTGIEFTKKLHQNSNPQAPGQLDKHYSPRKTLVLTNDIQNFILKNPLPKTGCLLFGNKKAEGIPNNQILNLSPVGSDREAAANLYEYLRMLDSMDVNLIVAEKLPEYGLGAAINDRLLRASIK